MPRKLTESPRSNWVIWSTEKANFCVSENIQQYKKGFLTYSKIYNVLKKNFWLAKNWKIDQISPVDPTHLLKDRRVLLKMTPLPQYSIKFLDQVAPTTRGVEVISGLHPKIWRNSISPHSVIHNTVSQSHLS